MKTLREFVFGVPHPVRHGAVRLSSYESWRSRSPAWLVSLVYTSRLFFMVAAVFGVPIIVGQFAGRGWRNGTFFAIIALIFWGYTHELIKGERRLRP